MTEQLSEISKEIPLAHSTQVLFAQVDERDYSLLSRHKWHAQRVRESDLYYAVTNIGGTTILMHQMVIGPPPRGLVVDHINGDGLDNRLRNLQYLTNAENIRKRYRGNMTGIKMVEGKITNPYKVQVSLGGKTTHVGYFPTAEEGLRARNKAIEKYIKENS